MGMRVTALGLFLAFLLHAQDLSLRLMQLAAGLTNPTDIQHAGDGTNRLFVVQQNGVIRLLSGGVLQPAPFLDIRNRTVGSGERGLLGLAFPAGYSGKRYFYVNYTNLAGDTVIARYRTTADPNVADPASETILLTIAQPYSNHNGGQLRFGPDGYLYVGMGDGGSGGDPQNNAQSRRTLLGKMLRLDVESDLARVLIPPDNPFVNDDAARPEIWALGLRNPWRFSFDRATGDLWIADVGQNRAEEIDFQPASSRGGENYGWNLMEGMQCYRAGCNTAGLTLPVIEYVRSEGCSVTGGLVYRGRESPGLRGMYLYGDFCTGRIWGLRREGDLWSNRLLLPSGLSISTFGEDEAGEIFVADYGGAIYRIGGPVAPFLTSAGVTNAASYESGLVAGSLATIFAAGVKDDTGIASADRVPLPSSITGVTVTINGFTAPVLAVANVNGQEQVNVQTPWQLAGAVSASVVVTRDGRSSTPVDVPVLARQPGIFTVNGRDAVIVHHADNTLVTVGRPLVRGEYAYFYAAGLGPVDHAPPSGSGGPRDPLAAARADVRVTLGGVPCETQYSGLAPDFVGVYQVNIRVPDGVPSGTLELILQAGESRSPVVEVAVQ
jgi:uncharacterized protein (TIGR03437 family)